MIYLYILNQWINNNNVYISSELLINNVNYVETFLKYRLPVNFLRRWLSGAFQVPFLSRPSIAQRI
jgi:hypothetical protein